MSEENVETVRRIFDSFAVVQDDLRRGDLPIGKPWAEDVEFDASDLGLPDLGDGRLRGHEGVRRFWVAWLAAWEDITFEYELRDAGEHVVALLEQQMHGSEGMELVGRYAQLWTFKDGEVVRWEGFRDQREALEAAGLQE
jgi:ketosteroid isomerase-like protein